MFVDVRDCSLMVAGVPVNVPVKVFLIDCPVHYPILVPNPKAPLLACDNKRLSVVPQVRKRSPKFSSYIRLAAGYYDYHCDLPG